MKIDKVFFENTIFVVSSIQEAEGLAILAQNYDVKYCVLLAYIEYTESQIEIIQAILARTKIEYIFTLDLWLPQNYFNESSVVLKKISWNQKRIQAFNDEHFNGKLFLSGFNIVCNIYSPFINLVNYDTEKIYIMEHSPFDSFSKIYKKIKKPENERYKYLHRANEIAKKVFKRRNIGTIKNLIVFLYLRKKYPLLFGMGNINKRFSWALVNNPDFFYLDARKYNLPLDVYNRCIQIKNTNGMALLLVDHPKQFLPEEQLYEEAMHINYMDVYKNIVLSHIKPEMTIIYKLHPWLYTIASLNEIRCYQEQLEHELHEIGYMRVHEFHSVICDDVVSKFPVECFFSVLPITKVVGIMSSVMEIAQYWPKVEVIADLRHVPFMKEIWQNLYDGLPMPNYKVFL